MIGESGVIVAVLLALAMVAQGQPVAFDKAVVIDGETLEIEGERIAMWGVDAPAPGQTCTRGDETYDCGQEAADALTNFLANQNVRCTPKPSRGGQAVAHCAARYTECYGTECNDRWRDISEELIAEGLGVQRRDETGGAYDADAETARIGHAGIWDGEGWRGDPAAR